MPHSVYHILTETEPFSEYSGGAISRWAANVLRDDDTSIILCPFADDSWKFPSERVRPLPRLHRYRSVRRLGSRLSWGLRRKMLAAIFRPGLLDLKPNDIVWVHNRPDFAAAISPAVRAAGARVVLHMHNSHLAHSKRISSDIQADHFIFVSRFLQAEARNKLHGLTNSTVIYNGADQTLFYPRSDGGAPPNGVPKILFASRLVPEKGAHVFLEAMRTLAQKGIQVQGIMVGASHFGGSKQTKYMNDLYKSAPQNVAFLPYRVGKELADLFRHSDIFCLPSIWQDPFPLAPLEAMACRLPVVATKSGGIPEAFEQGGALLVSRGSVEELAGALERLIMQPELRAKLGEEGRASFRQNFTWASVQKQYQAAVSRLG